MTYELNNLELIKQNLFTMKSLIEKEGSLLSDYDREKMKEVANELASISRDIKETIQDLDNISYGDIIIAKSKLTGNECIAIVIENEFITEYPCLLIDLKTRRLVDAFPSIEGLVHDYRIMKKLDKFIIDKEEEQE